MSCMKPEEVLRCRKELILKGKRHPNFQSISDESPKYIEPDNTENSGSINERDCVLLYNNVIRADINLTKPRVSDKI